MIRFLQQLIIEEAGQFLLAYKAAMNHFYVDDPMTRVNSISEAHEFQGQLMQCYGAQEIYSEEIGI